MIIRFTSAVGLFLLFLLAPVAATGSADDDLDDIKRDLGKIDETITNLPRRYLNQKSVRSSSYAEERLADAGTFFQLKDYHNAAIIYLEIVETYPNHSVYADAAFHLAESLFNTRDYFGAKRYYSKILDHAREPLYRNYVQSSLARLIEIGIITRNFDEIHKYIDRMENLPGNDAQYLTLYVKGKYLYFQDMLEQALPVFEQVPRSSPYYLQSRYFIGVILSRTGKFPEALEDFKTIPGLAPEGMDAAEARKIRELAQLAVGRLNYELGNLDKSIEAYEKIPRDSMFFDTALFEVAWVYIKFNDPPKAVRALEVLTVAAPKSKHIPDAKLLRGNLLLRAGRYEEAKVVFDDMISQFTPAKEQMEGFVRQRRNAKDYFVELVNRNMEVFNATSFLPAVALEWVTEEEEVTRALDTLGDLSESRRQIKELERLIMKMETAVYGPSKVYVFPLLREGHREGQKVANSLARHRSAVLAIEEKEFSGQGDSAELKQLRAERRSLERELKGLPTNDEEMYLQDREAIVTVGEARKELAKNNIRLDQLQAIISATDKYVRDTSGSEGPEPAVMDELRLHRLGLANLRNEASKIKDGLDKLEILMSSGAVKAEEQKALRNRIAEISRKERALIRGKSGGLATKIDSVMNKIDSLDTTVAAFMTGLENEAESQIEDIKRQLAVEKKNVEKYRARLEELKNEAEIVIGGVAYENFVAVRMKFYNLVLRADVGVIDVAWMTKEEHSKRIEQMTRDRSKEFKYLDSEFKEVLKGSKPAAP